MTTITHNGQTFDFDAAVNLMDDDIREMLHSKAGVDFEETEQAFFDAYVAAHLAKFGEEFVIN